MFFETLLFFLNLLIKQVTFEEQRFIVSLNVSEKPWLKMLAYSLFAFFIFLFHYLPTQIDNGKTG